MNEPFCCCYLDVEFVKVFASVLVLVAMCGWQRSRRVPCPRQSRLYCPAAASSNQWPVEGRPQIAIHSLQSTVNCPSSITIR